MQHHKRELEVYLKKGLVFLIWWKGEEELKAREEGWDIYWEGWLMIIIGWWAWWSVAVWLVNVANHGGDKEGPFFKASSWRINQSHLNSKIIIIYVLSRRKKKTRKKEKKERESFLYK